MLVRKTIKAEVAYLESLESNDMFSKAESKSKDGEKKKGKKLNRAQTPQAAALKGCITALTGLHGKLYGDLPFAKRDIAYGKLGAKDLDEIFARLRAILVPLVGISTITDIFERIAERRGWVEGDNADQARSDSWERCEPGTKAEEIRVWNQIMKALHEPFAVAAVASKFLFDFSQNVIIDQKQWTRHLNTLALYLNSFRRQRRQINLPILKQMQVIQNQAIITFPST